MSVIDTDFAIVRPRRDAVAAYTSLTAVSIVAMVLYVGAGQVDPRVLSGDGVWIKPLKFALSFTLLFATLALLATRLSDRVRYGRAMHAIFVIFAVCFLSEMGYMSFQSSLGEASHFNVSTPFHALAYQLMGVAAVAMIACVAVIGWNVARDRGAAIGPQTRAGVIFGFALTFVLTFIVAGYMGGNGSHFVGAPGPNAKTLPFLGWSASVGDLRPPHFLSLHAMQALPLLGLALDRARIKARGIMVVAGFGYGALTLALFAQALMGLPLIHL
jgi:hypothetical protein